MSDNQSIKSPIPKRSHNLRSNNPVDRLTFRSPLLPGFNFHRLGSGVVTPLTPNPNPVEQIRLRNFNLDYPPVSSKEFTDIYDKDSRFYSRIEPRTLDLPLLLPYDTELPIDQSRYLSHVISHLYISIKSLDLAGVISISPRDLQKLNEAASKSNRGIHDNLKDHESYSKTKLHEDNDEDAEDEAESDDYDSDDDGDDSDDDDDNFLNDDIGGEISSGMSTYSSKHRYSALVITVRYWTLELRTWLKMKNDLPFSLRIILAKVYYALCFISGQQMPLNLFVDMFIYLTRFQLDVLKEKGLVLDHKLLLNYVNSRFPSPDALVDKNRGSADKSILKLGFVANFFFSHDIFDEIFAYIVSKLSLNTVYVSLVSLFGLLPLGSPKIIVVLPTIINMWCTVLKVKGSDAHITSILGSSFERLFSNQAKDQSLRNNFGKYGFLTENQLLYVFSHILTSFNIQHEKFGVSLSGRFYIGYANIIVFNINSEEFLNKDGLYHHLETLLNTIETYLHPSNTGIWSGACTKFIHELVSNFHRRYGTERVKGEQLYHLPNELKLSDACVRSFVRLLLPKVLIGIQSKSSKITNINTNLIKLLCDLDSKYVLNNVLLMLYESLQSVLSNHRLIVALKLMVKLAKYFATEKLFRCHVANLLNLCLPGIDSNDLSKTLLTVNLIAAYASYIPFSTLSLREKDGDEDLIIDPGISFEVTQSHLEFLSEKVYDSSVADTKFYFKLDDGVEKKALMSSTFIFEEIVRSLAVRIIALLENLPDQSSHQSDGETTLEGSLPRSLLILFESMSDELFEIFSNMFMDFVESNIQYNTIHISMQICGAIVKRSNEEQVHKIIKMIFAKIDEQYEIGIAGKHRSGTTVLSRDKPLYCFTFILAETSRYAGSVILDYQTQISGLLLKVLDDVRGPINFVSSYVLMQLLKGLTSINLKEQRLLSPVYVAEHGITEECWGAFCDTPERLNLKYLDFAWSKPTKESIDYTVKLSGEIIGKSFRNLDELMASLKREHKNMKAPDANTNLKEKDEEEMVNEMRRNSLGNTLDLDMEVEESSKTPDLLEFTDKFRKYLLFLSRTVQGLSLLLDPSYQEKPANEKVGFNPRLLDIKLKALNGSQRNLTNASAADTVQKTSSPAAGALLNDVDFFAKDRTDQIISVKNQADEGLLTSVGSVTSLVNLGASHDRSTYNSSHFLGTEGTLTPDILNDLMNPSLTMRAQKIYTCNYYFGDTLEERQKHDLYFTIHNFYKDIGEKLHAVFLFLREYFPNDIVLNKAFLNALNIWFVDYGADGNLRLFDDNLISYKYMKALQRCAFQKKPFTRITLGARIEKYHRQRVLIHASSRLQNNLYRNLIVDLVYSSMSIYSSIASYSQLTLQEAAKKISGLSSLLINTAFRAFEETIASGDYKKIQSAMKIFKTKRIKNKLYSNHKNVTRYLSLIFKCIGVDDVKTSDLATRYYKKIGSNFYVSNTEAFFDESQFDIIKPDNSDAEKDIKLIKELKKYKRVLYINNILNLQKTVYNHETSRENHWVVTVTNLNILKVLQTNNYLIPLDADIFELFTKYANATHPIISNTAISALQRLFGKINNLSLYSYNTKDIMDYYVSSPEFYEILTDFNQLNINFLTIFDEELKKTGKDANYFIDNKLYRGWIAWDKELFVIKNEKNNQLNLKENELNLLSRVNKYINKKWLKAIFLLIVGDNEEDAIFQASHVYFITWLVRFTAAKHLNNISFVDILDIIKELYLKDEKSNNVVVCEIICGVLIASKYCTDENLKVRDIYLEDFFTKIFADLNPENAAVWKLLVSWLSTVSDFRRYNNIFKIILDYRTSSKERPFVQATRLSYLKIYLRTVNWKNTNGNDIMEDLLKVAFHPYQIVANEIGATIYVALHCNFHQSFANTSKYISANSAAKNSLGLIPFKTPDCAKELLISIFDKIEVLRQDVIQLSAAEILKSPFILGSRTMIAMLNCMTLASSSISLAEIIPTHISPFLLNLINMRDTYTLAGLDPVNSYIELAKLPYRMEHVETIIRMILDNGGLKNPTWHQLIILLIFSEIFYFRQLVLLNVEQKRALFDFTFELLFHSQMEVRQRAASTLSGMIHCSTDAERDENVSFYINKFAKILANYKGIYKLHKKNKKKPSKSSKRNLITSEDTIKFHGATLGLGAIVNAFPYLSPPPIWFPKLLGILSGNILGLSGIIDKTSKDILSNFKKTRQDTWHIDNKIFSEGQLEDLEGVLRENYFV